MSILTQEEISQIYEVKLIKIIDGDTIDLSVNLGLGQFLNTRIRLLNIDAPEIYGVKTGSKEFEKGMNAVRHVYEYMKDAPEIFYLKSELKGIYGRWLGEIWKEVGQESLNDYLISNGYNSEYWTKSIQQDLINDWYNSDDFYIWGKNQFIDGKSGQLKKI